MPAPTTVFACTIGGAPARLARDSFSISRQLGARDEISLAVRDVRPASRAKVQLSINGTLHAGGIITERDESGPASGLTYVSTLTVVGFEKYLDDAVVTEEYAAGLTLKAVLSDLTTKYLAGYGLSLAPTTATGPTLAALSYQRKRLGDILRELTTAAGLIYFVGEDEVLYVEAAGVRTAPWAITNTNRVIEGDLRVSTSAVEYANRVIVVAGEPSAPIVATAENAAEISAKGLAAIVVSAPGVLDAGAAQTLASAILTKKLPDVVTLRFRTFQHGLRPGQVLSVTRSERAVSGDFLIQSVSESWPARELYQYDVEATSVLYALDSYLDTLRSWSSGSADAYSALIAAGPGGITTYDLGGDEIQVVDSPIPSWVRVRNAKSCVINGDSFAGRLAVAYVRVRAAAAGVSVTARIKNLTTGAIVATGTLYTGTTWSAWEPLTLALAGGANQYELEVLPGTAGEGVTGQCYVQIH